MNLKFPLAWHGSGVKSFADRAGQDLYPLRTVLRAGLGNVNTELQLVIRCSSSTRRFNELLFIDHNLPL